MSPFVQALVNWVREDPRAFPWLVAGKAPETLAGELISNIEECADTLEASGADPMGLAEVIKDMVREIDNAWVLRQELGAALVGLVMERIGSQG